MLDHLTGSVGHLGHWGYLVIFLVVRLECQALLGLFMPGESLVLLGGFFAEQGLLHPGILIGVVAGAAILGDSIGYELGRQLGRGWLLKQGERWGLRQQHLDRVDGFFLRHGGKAVFGSHFLHLLRALMPFVAGARRMRYPKFLLFNAAGCVVWATVFVFQGYWAGASWRAAARWIGGASEIVGAAVPFVVVLGWLWRWLVRHEADVRRRWQELSKHPRLTALRRRFSPQLDFLQTFQGYSFPSGHTMAATLLYGLLAAFAVSALETWRWRVGAVLGAVLVALLVGFSRVYLGAHYLSDVLGAAAAGLAWLALSLTAVDTLRRSRGRAA